MSENTSKDTSTSKEIENKETDVKAVATQGEQFLRHLRKIATDNIEHQRWTVMEKQVASVFAATDLETLLDADESTGIFQSRDLNGLVITIPDQDLSRQVYPSSDKFNAVFDVYIQFEATALTNLPTAIKAGDKILITSGAPLVITKLMALKANEFLPVTVQVQTIETQNGAVVRLARSPLPTAATSKP